MAMGYSETRNSLDVDSMLLPWITLIDLFFFEIIYLSIRWRARRTSKDIDIYISMAMIVFPFEQLIKSFAFSSPLF